MQRSKRAVLLVDDHEDARVGLRTILEAEGFDIEMVRDGSAALAKMLGGLRPCVILYDLMSPTMNGVEFRRQQLEIPELRAIPLVTYAGLKDLRGQAKRYSADDPSLSADVGRILDAVRQHCPA